MEKFKWPLRLISAIADLIAIILFLPTIVKQDLLLIILMIVAVIAIAGLVYLVISKLVGIPLILTVIGSLVLAIVAWSLLASSELTPLDVNITDPKDGGRVTWSKQGYLAKGTVSDPNARVYVLVRTLPVTEMWVQQPAIVDGGGNWQASVFFGNETISIKERYEAIAVATSDNFLVTWATGNSFREGQKVQSLPRKSNKSSLITVTRSN